MKTPQPSPLASILYALFCTLVVLFFLGMLCSVGWVIRNENATRDHNGGIARIETQAHSDY
jgi:hypothetical protein